MKYYDFNTAEATNNYDVIPKGTLAKVKMKIQSGGYNDESQGWTGGYATKNDISGAVYLKCEFTIIAGEYCGRKVWSMIGLHSHKNDNIWGSIGRSFIRSILNSKFGFTDNDESEAAIKARKISSFAELDGIEFIAKIDTTTSDTYGEQNLIKAAIAPEHKQYESLMNQVSSANASNVGHGFINDDIPWQH